MSSSPGAAISRDHAAWLLDHRSRWLLCLCALLGGVIAIYAFTVGSARQRAIDRLEKAEAQLRALQPKPIPEAENAAVVYRKAFDAMKAPTPADPDPHGAPPSDRAAKWYLLEDEEYVAAASEVLAKSGDALRLGEQASQIPACNWENDYTNTAIPHAPPTFRLAKLFFARAGLAFRDGKLDDAEKDLRTVLRMSQHHLTDRRMWSILSAMRLSSQCRSMLENGLEHSPAEIAPTQLDGWIGVAQSEADWNPPFGDALEAEKLTLALRCDELAAGRADERAPVEVHFMSSSSRQKPTTNATPPLFAWYGLVYESDRASCLRLSDRLREEVERASKTFTPLDDRDLRRETRRSLFRMEFGAAQLSLRMIPPDVILQSRIAWRLTHIGLAALKWRRANGNAWPKELDQLGLPAETLRDPFSKENGKVRWKIDAKSGDLWLWSVGRDGRDESAQRDVNNPGSVKDWRDKNILFHIQATMRKEAQKP